MTSLRAIRRPGLRWIVTALLLLGLTGLALSRIGAAGAAGNRDVKALVYVDAFLPAQGETIAQLVGAQPDSLCGRRPDPDL